MVTYWYPVGLNKLLWAAGLLSVIQTCSVSPGYKSEADQTSPNDRSVWETRSWGDPPSRGGPSPSRGYFSLCITIYRRKNQNCKKRQWCLWRFMCPLSMHQFIEISICALENKINSNISMSSDPWKSVRQRVFPCTAAETIGRTKLPSSIWEENEFRGFPHETPTMPVVYRRSWNNHIINIKPSSNYTHSAVVELLLCDSAVCIVTVGWDQPTKIPDLGEF